MFCVFVFKKNYLNVANSNDTEKYRRFFGFFVIKERHKSQRSEGK